MGSFLNNPGLLANSLTIKNSVVVNLSGRGLPSTRILIGMSLILIFHG